MKLFLLILSFIGSLFLLYIFINIVSTVNSYEDWLFLLIISVLFLMSISCIVMNFDWFKRQKHRIHFRIRNKNYSK